MRDHVEEILTDDDVHRFYMNGEDQSFQCIPSKTTNFDIFMLANPTISMEKCRAIWEYYRSLFIGAKLNGDDLSHFRNTLQRFVEGKSYRPENDIPFGTDSDRTRKDDINSYIGIARWLELQFNVDVAVDQLSEGWTKEKLYEKASHILGTVPFNNYISYFTNDIHKKLKNPEDYTNRKLKLKSVYAYNHKEIRWYICASQFGAVKIWVHTKHNPFLKMFENRIKNGVEIKVVTSKILMNIDNSTPYIKVENFFLED